MKQILIIDDDIYIGNMLEEVLTKENFQVLRAYSGTEALLALSSARPDLILLDLMLPGLSGEELLPKVKDIPVIVLSAKADLDSKVSLLLEGACDYVTKPFEIRIGGSSSGLTGVSIMSSITFFIPANPFSSIK